MIQNVVIPAAGLGTRLFPATKEQPKEMLPVFSRLVNGDIGVKPLLQLVFEQLFDAGFPRFCFIVGRGKRAIEDHFTPDFECISLLNNAKKVNQVSDLEDFYLRLKGSKIIWVNQPRPKGFGDAVLMAQPFVQKELCLVHAGDTYIVSKNAKHLKLLMGVYRRYKADAAFIVQEIEDPRQYGVIEAKEVESGIYSVNKVIEKPEKPPTNLAILPIYIFNHFIFRALEETPIDKRGELQLSDALQKLIDWDLKVCAIRLDTKSTRLDIGTPETYWEALQLSHQCATKEGVARALPISESIRTSMKCDGFQRLRSKT
jgi:UTP--glucose-1-phosphate uridylyltransferase